MILNRFFFSFKWIFNHKNWINIREFLLEPKTTLNFNFIKKLKILSTVGKYLCQSENIMWLRRLVQFTWRGANTSPGGLKLL